MGNGIETECLLLSAKNCISPTRQPKTFKANYFSLSINYSLFLPFSFCASCINVQPEETIVTVNFIDYNTGRPVASCKGAYSSLGVAGASHDIKGAINRVAKQISDTFNPQKWKSILGFHLALYQSSNHTDLPRHRQPRWVYGDVLLHQRAVGVPHSHRAMCRPLSAARWFRRSSAWRSWCRRLRRERRLTCAVPWRNG